MEREKSYQYTAIDEYSRWRYVEAFDEHNTYTPRHNGKVERSHRKDNERFYATHTFYSFEDFSRQLQLYNRRDYNRFPMRPLGWKSPHTVLKEFVQWGVTYV